MDKHGITDFNGWTVDATHKDDKQGVSYEMFVVPLVKAVQELKAELDAAKTRIATLEADNDTRKRFSRPVKRRSDDID